MQKFSLLFLNLIIITVLLTSCGPTRYSMKEPEFKDIQVTGLDPKTEIVEATDIYNDRTAGDNVYWLVLKQDKKYQIGQIDITTGIVTNMKPLDTYSSEKPLYWTKLMEDKMSGGAKLFGMCMSGTAIGGTKEDYSFIAEKYFDGDEQHRVHVEYSIKETGSQDWQAKRTEKSWAGRLKFLHGDNTMEPLSVYGHQDIFTPNSNVLRSRYYPIGEKQYVSVQPEEPKGASRVALIYFDLGRDKSSWGAQYSLPKKYVDCCVGKDGKKINFIIGKEGNYVLRQYFSESVISNVKKLKK